MTAIIKAARVTPTSMTPPVAMQVGSGLICGEDLGAGDPCYIKSSDGLVYRSNGTAANAAAKVVGYAYQACKVAQSDAVTLYDGLDWGWTAGQFALGNVGKNVFLGAGAGVLDIVASTGGVAPIGTIIDDQRIRLFSSRY